MKVPSNIEVIVNGQVGDHMVLIKGLRSYSNLTLKEAKDVKDEMVASGKGMVFTRDFSKSDESVDQGLTMIRSSGAHIIDKENESVESLARIAVELISSRRYRKASDILDILDRWER